MSFGYGAELMSCPKVTAEGMNTLYIAIEKAINEVNEIEPTSEDRYRVAPLRRCEGGLSVYGGPDKNLENDTSQKPSKQMRLPGLNSGTGIRPCRIENGVYIPGLEVPPIPFFSARLSLADCKKNGPSIDGMYIFNNSKLVFKCSSKPHHWTLDEVRAVEHCFQNIGFVIKPAPKKGWRKIAKPTKKTSVSK